MNAHFPRSLSTMSSTEYPDALLQSLDILIRREIKHMRRTRASVFGTAPTPEWQGLVISDAEADALVNRSASAQRSSQSSEHIAADETDAALEHARSRIAQFESDAQARGDTLRFCELVTRFHLDDFEKYVLLIALATELDLKYERLYAYLNDDVTRTRPTIELALRLLCATPEERFILRRAFASSAPLCEWQLITFVENSHARPAAQLARPFQLNERIVEYLMGWDDIDTRLRPLFVREHVTNHALPVAVQEQLRQWADGWSAWRDAAPVIHIHGRYGSGKRAAAQFLCDALNRPLVLLDAAELANANATEISNALKLAERETRLSSALIGWMHADALLDAQREANAARRVFLKRLAAQSTPTFLFTERAWEPGASLASRPLVRLELDMPTLAERRELWMNRLNGSGQFLSDAELDALAARYRLTAGQIHDAVQRAHALAWTRDAAQKHVAPHDVNLAARSQMQPALGMFARKIEPHYGWDDIVLPPQPLATLQMICAVMRQRARVYGEWGLGKWTQGAGILALFAGASGTGKTMAAEIIARELALDLYKIDLSAVVSKYIGETEKNLERIFREAEDSAAILFFDEADALFGKRSEVRDAHDRYANIEVAYLLQRTEQYDGLVILTSNLKKNMDDAFLRRIHFAVEFPLPEEAERFEIWRRTLPPTAPQADDIDLELLARKLKLAGGSIRNIVLAAAFLAADERVPVAMRHLTRAANYEYQKIGKLMVEGVKDGSESLARQ